VKVSRAGWVTRLNQSFTIGRFAGQCVLGVALILAAVSQARAQAEPATSESVMRAAFANRYELDAISRVELVMHSAAGENQRRKVHYVTKMIDQRLHSVARLTAPEYLRGMTILTIEQSDRSHDAFAFLPALGKARRVSSAQKGDAFFGSDLTYEDLERKRIDEFAFGELVSDELEGESVYRVGGTLVEKGDYSRVEFYVAQSDGAILETRFFRGDDEAPYRMLQAPRAAMVVQGGHVLPTRLLVRNIRNESSTEVLISDLHVNAKISDRVFTVATLEQERKLPRPNP
jgi:hypothetical protein